MMKNEETRQNLRQRIAETPRNSSGYRRYEAELKRDIVEYTRLCTEQGNSVMQTAGELGLDYGLLTKWIRHAQRRQGLGKEPFATSRTRRARPPQPTHHPLLKSIASPDSGSVQPIILLIVADGIQQSAISRTDLTMLLAIDP